MKNVINVDSLKMEIEKRVHVAMIHARNTKQEPSIMPMLHDTVNIIMEATHSLLISKLPEKKNNNYVTKSILLDETRGYNSALDDVKAVLDELFGVQNDKV